MISVSSAVFYIASTFFLLFVSRWGDRVKEKEYLLVASYFIRALGFLSYLLIRNPFFLIITQIIFGLGDALGTPTFSALFAHHADRNEEVLEYSDWAFVANIVMALGAVVGGFFVTTFGFGVMFVTMATMCLISAIGVLLTPRKIL